MAGETRIEPRTRCCNADKNIIYNVLARSLDNDDRTQHTRRHTFKNVRARLYVCAYICAICYVSECESVPVNEQRGRDRSRSIEEKSRSLGSVVAAILHALWNVQMLLL